MTAGRVDLMIDQGADFVVQIYWTDGSNSPFTVLAPMRMDIKNGTGQIVATLQTDDAAPEDSAKTIIYNSDSGLIQLQLGKEKTGQMGAGRYVYDLFVNYHTGNTSETEPVRLTRLIEGVITVNGRVTKNV